jgi:hypothetical protein
MTHEKRCKAYVSIQAHPDPTSASTLASLISAADLEPT